LLGIYSLALKIMLLPVQNLASVASRAIFPALCRQRADKPAMAALYLRAVSAVALVTAPAMTGIFVLREPLVDFLFGPAWSEVAHLLKWLAPVGCIQALTTGTGVVFLALGETRLLLRLGVLGTSLMVASFLIGPAWGIEGVALCYLIANAINLLPCFYLSLKKLDIGLRDGAIAVGAPALASLLMCLALNAMSHTVNFMLAGAAARLVLLIALGAVVYLFILLVVLRKDATDLKALLAFR
jgi:PST family polysaccharide transporter